MRFLIPLIFLVMTALLVPRETDTKAQPLAVTEQARVEAVPADEEAGPSAGSEAIGYGELVESPGLLNSVTIFGY